jgi:hypothetical protein
MNVVKPAVPRGVAGHLQTAFGISQLRACSATGFQRSSQRYCTRSDPQIEPRMRLKELAAAGCTFCCGGRAGRCTTSALAAIDRKAEIGGSNEVWVAADLGVT